jgi:hypothetical protein
MSTGTSQFRADGIDRNRLGWHGHEWASAHEACWVSLVVRVKCALLVQRHGAIATGKDLLGSEAA